MIHLTIDVSETKAVHKLTIAESTNQEVNSMIVELEKLKATLLNSLKEESLEVQE